MIKSKWNFNDKQMTFSYQNYQNKYVVFKDLQIMHKTKYFEKHVFDKLNIKSLIYFLSYTYLLTEKY